MKLASCKSALNPPPTSPLVVYSTDRSKVVVPVSRKMFKTMRCFRTHAQRKRILGGAKGVRFVRIYLPQFDFLFCCCLYKEYFFFLFSVLRLNLEYPDELWRYLSYFDTWIIFNICWHTAWRTKTCIHIRRVRLFTYQLTVWYLQKCSFVFLMYIMIRRLHKNEQNLENRGCVETGCVTSDVRTVLGFVHVTWMTIFTERTTVGFDAV